MKPRKAKVNIHPSQRNNPYLNLSRIQSQTVEDQKVDFYFPDTKVCCLFVSLSFHYNNPIYFKEIIGRALEQGITYSSKFFVLMQDREDTQNEMYNIQDFCLEKDFQILLYEDGKSFTSLIKSLETDFK